MKLIELTQGYYAKIDDDDFDKISKFSWSIHKGRNTNYAKSTIKIDGKWKHIKMHRMILNVPKNLQIDHKDRDGLNNQKLNLRICTNSENQKNKKASGKSKYLGVSLHQCTNIRFSKKIKSYIAYKSKVKFIAHIKYAGKYMHLGLFNNEIEAALAYNEAAKKYHGEFANLNKIREGVYR